MGISKIEGLVEEELLVETPDTSNPIDVNKQRKKAARTRVDRLHFVEAAMTTEQGRAWFYDLLVRCRVVSTPFTDDPYRTAFNCGMANIGLQVMQDIQDSAPENYIKMVTECRNK